MEIAFIVHEVILTDNMTHMGLKDFVEGRKVRFCDFSDGRQVRARCSPNWGHPQAPRSALRAQACYQPSLVEQDSQKR